MRILILLLQSTVAGIVLEEHAIRVGGRGALVYLLDDVVLHDRGVRADIDRLIAFLDVKFLVHFFVFLQDRRQVHPGGEGEVGHLLLLASL